MCVAPTSHQIASEVNAKLACKECMCIADVSADSAEDFMAGAAISTITARGQEQTGSEQYACVQTLTWPADGGKTRECVIVSPPHQHGATVAAVRLYMPRAPGWVTSDLDSKSGDTSLGVSLLLWYPIGQVCPCGSCVGFVLRHS